MSTPTIKFRGVRKDNGEYVFGSLVYNPNVKCEILSIEIKTNYYSFINTHDVHPDSVAQYTCMNDRNGIEIYGSIYLDGKLTKGGDIAIIKHPYKRRTWKGEIVYDRYKFEGRNFFFSHFDTPNDLFSEGAKYITVLGSLFLNHELLK